MSPLTQGLNYRSACDTQQEETIVQSYNMKTQVKISQNFYVVKWLVPWHCL